MSRLVLWGTFVVYSCGFLLGCGSEKQVSLVTVEEHAHDEHLAEEKTEMNEAFAELSSSDRKLVEAQKICPVSDQALGSMGTPIKVTVEGRDVFVCCKGCVDELKSKFAEYVAKIEK
jgi:hypothetical protein